MSEEVKEQVMSTETVSPEQAARDMLRKVSKGKTELLTPFENEGKTITEIEYDFTLLSGTEYAECMDSDYAAPNVFKTTDKQALNLFAKAVVKACGIKYGIDVKDVIRALGVVDARWGIQTALVFQSLCERVKKPII